MSHKSNIPVARTRSCSNTPPRLRACSSYLDLILIQTTPTTDTVIIIGVNFKKYGYCQAPHYRDSCLLRAIPYSKSPILSEKLIKLSAVCLNHCTISAITDAWLARLCLGHELDQTRPHPICFAQTSNSDSDFSPRKEVNAICSPWSLKTQRRRYFRPTFCRVV